MTQTRFKSLSLDQMTSDQRQIVERRMNGSLRRLGAVMDVFIRRPALAVRLEPLSDYFRIEPLSIPDCLREMVILMIAGYWKAQYPWSVHYPLALEAGFSATVLNQIGAGQRPMGLQPDEAIVHDFCKQLLDEKSVTDPVFAAVVDRFGEPGVADLIGLIGCYTNACLATVVSRYPSPKGPAPLLEALAQGK